MRAPQLGLIIFIASLITACGSDDDDSACGIPAGTTMSNRGMLTVGVPSNQAIGIFGTEFYEFTTGGVDSIHTISLTNTDSDLSWDLYSDSGFTSFITRCDNSSVAADEICTTPTLTASTTYYLMIDEWDDVLNCYAILVETP